jgi:uncharacterized membrane protein
MRASVLATVLLATMSTASLANDSVPESVKGLYFATDFPALQIHAGEETTLLLTIYNYGLPPQRAALSIAEKPQDWKAEIDGGNKPIGAAFVDYNGRANLSLKLTAPASAKPGPYKIVLDAVGEDAKSALPIAIDLAAPLAAKLTATPKFPVLRGSPKSSFDFAVTLKNESAEDTIVNLKAAAPDGFTTTFKQGYGSQEIISLPLKAGESKDLTVSVKPAPGASAGKVPVDFSVVGDKASAETKLTLDIEGQPSISISGQDDRLSGEAYAGEQRSIPLIVRNDGTATAEGLALASTPPSGWTISFDPKQLPPIPAGGQQKVNALLTPSAKVIAGDYMLGLTASGEGVSESANYRVTVLTSTLWGVTGVGVIAAALLVLVGAVGRFGRR